MTRFTMKALIFLSCISLAAGLACPAGWFEYSNRCYFVTATSAEGDMTWHEAQDFCFNNGANLASIHNDEDRNRIIAKANENGFTGTLWIGYNRLDNREGSFQWTDASSTAYEDWGPSQPSSGGLENCAHMVQSHSNQDASSFERHIGHNVIKGLVGTPDEADGVDTFDFGDIFDYVHDDCEKRCDAEPKCMAYSQFPTWHSGVFNARCMGRSNKNEVFEPESDVLSGLRIVTPPGYWYSSNCGYRMGLVCTRSNDEVITPITTQSTPSTNGYCPIGYFAIGNKCFMVVNGTAREGWTWGEALEFCRSQGGRQPDLASIQNVMENNALTAQLQQVSYGYWIGLHKGTEGAEWVWTDNGRTSYTKWHPGSPANNKGNCVEFWNNKYPGTWNDHYCDDKRGYICQTFKDGTVNNPPATTPNSCPSNYKPYWYGCYRFESERKSWNDADAGCRADGGHLVSVYSEAENAAINYYADMEEVAGEYFMWLGLQKGTDNQYRWTDGWTVFYTNWAAGEPKVDGGCVSMGKAGTWFDLKCTDKFPSMCKKTEETPFTSPTPRPGECPGPDWIAHGGHCYYFADAPSTGGEDNPHQSWENAQARCEALAGKTHRGHLVTIHSAAENAFVFGEMEGRLATNPNIWMTWIGLYKEDQQSSFKWVNDEAVQYDNWIPGEPDRNDRSACVQMHIQMWQGSWDDDDCEAPKYYICKAEKTALTEAPSTPPPVGGKCPSASVGVGDDAKDVEWDEVGDQCFTYFTGVALKHHNSTDQCRGISSLLPSVHSDAENYVLRQAFREGVLPWGWIGLYRKPGDDLNSFQWQDGTPYDYKNWENGEPNNLGGNEHCVEIDSSTGEWNDVECEIERPFACKAPKDVGGGSLSGGAIFGIIVGVLAGVLLLSVVAGIVIRHLRATDSLPSLPFDLPAFPGTPPKPQEPINVDNPNYDVSMHNEFSPSPVDTPTYDIVN